MSWVGLQCVIVVFHDHTHSFFSLCLVTGSNHWVLLAILWVGLQCVNVVHVHAFPGHTRCNDNVANVL